MSKIKSDKIMQSVRFQHEVVDIPRKLVTKEGIVVCTSSRSIRDDRSLNWTLGAAWILERLASTFAMVSSNDLREFLFAMFVVGRWIL